MITFIFAVYNQQHVLEKSIISLQKYLIDRSIDDSEIIICNDGSPDKCVEISDGLSKQFNNVISIGYKRNRGRGFAIKYAGTLAQGEHLLCLDCDLIIDRNFIFIDKMIKYIRIYDVVIASRFPPKARSTRKS